jgi:hypothetical protein
MPVRSCGTAAHGSWTPRPTGACARCCPSRATNFWSGLLACGKCGPSFIKVSQYRYGCGSYANGGAHACGNDQHARVSVLDQKILPTIKNDLLTPARIKLMERAMREYFVRSNASCRTSPTSRSAPEAHRSRHPGDTGDRGEAPRTRPPRNVSRSAGHHAVGRNDYSRPDDGRTVARLQLTGERIALKDHPLPLAA